MTPGVPKARFGDPLTERQVDILRCLADGHWNESAARELGISERTVRRNLLAAQTKLGAKSVTHHMGRVNSHRRLRYAAAIGCHSVDGTYLAFGPDINLPKLLGWLREVDGQGALWEAS